MRWLAIGRRNEFEPSANDRYLRILAIYGVVFARQQPPLHGVERGSRKARQRKGLGVRVLSCMIGSTVHAPKFLAAARRSSKVIAMSVSLGNRFELCALKGVVLPCPENPAYSRLDARWPAWRTAGCLGPLFAKCLGARSLLGCRALRPEIGVSPRPRGSRLRPRERNPCRRLTRASDIRPLQRRSAPSWRPLGL